MVHLLPEPERVIEAAQERTQPVPERLELAAYVEEGQRRGGQREEEGGHAEHVGHEQRQKKVRRHRVVGHVGVALPGQHHEREEGGRHALARVRDVGVGDDGHDGQEEADGHQRGVAADDADEVEQGKEEAGAVPEVVGGRECLAERLACAGDAQRDGEPCVGVRPRPYELRDGGRHARRQRRPDRGVDLGAEVRQGGADDFGARPSRVVVAC